MLAIRKFATGCDIGTVGAVQAPKKKVAAAPAAVRKVRQVLLEATGKAFCSMH